MTELQLAGGGIPVRVRCGEHQLRLRGGCRLQHEEPAGRDPPAQHHQRAGGGQDGAKDLQTSPGQGLPPLPHLAVLQLGRVSVPGQQPRLATPPGLRPPGLQVISPQRCRSGCLLPGRDLRRPRCVSASHQDIKPSSRPGREPSRGGES